MLPGETLANGCPVLCPDCQVEVLPLRVLPGSAGYYIGTRCNCGSAYTRESDYYPTEALAEAALADRSFGRGGIVARNIAVYWTDRVDPHPFGITVLHCGSRDGCTRPWPLARWSGCSSLPWWRAPPRPPARSPTPSPTANRTGWCATPATLSGSPPTGQPGCGRWRSAMCWLPATRLAPDRLGLQAIHVRPAVGHPALPRLLSMVWGPAHAHDRMAAMSAEDYRPAGAIAPGWRGHGGRLLMVISTGCRCPVRPPPRAGWPGAAPPLGSGTGFAGQRRS
jgi:hypothetical protein